MKRNNYLAAVLFSFASTAGADGTRPTTTSGTSVTPGASNNYAGSYTSLGVLDATNDVYWIELIVHTASENGATRMIMAKLAKDPAGGTSFTDFWNGILVGAPLVFVTNGLAYTRIVMPHFLKAGTSLGVDLASLNATVTAVRVIVNGTGKPSNENLPVGKKITTHGVTEPTVGGTAFTPGGASEGAAWVQIGAATLTGDEFYLNVGFSVNDSTMTTAITYIDVAIGDGTNFTQVIRDLPVFTNANEVLQFWTGGVQIHPKAGDKIYVRGQSSAAPDANWSACAWVAS